MHNNHEYVSFKYNKNAQSFFCFDFSSNWVEGRISHDEVEAFLKGLTKKVRNYKNTYTCIGIYLFVVIAIVLAIVMDH